jgi:hypothetical protein
VKERKRKLAGGVAPRVRAMMETTGSGEWVGDWPDEGKMAAVSLLDESVEVAPEAVAVADASATATTDASATATTDASVVLTTDEPTTTSAPQLASGGSVAAPTSTDVSVEVAPGGSSASAETEADAPPAVGSTAWVRPDAEAQVRRASGVEANSSDGASTQLPPVRHPLCVL